MARICVSCLSLEINRIHSHYKSSYHALFITQCLHDVMLRHTHVTLIKITDYSSGSFNFVNKSFSTVSYKSLVYIR